MTRRGFLKRIGLWGLALVGFRMPKFNLGQSLDEKGAIPMTVPSEIGMEVREPVFNLYLPKVFR